MKVLWLSSVHWLCVSSTVIPNKILKPPLRWNSHCINFYLSNILIFLRTKYLQSSLKNCQRRIDWTGYVFMELYFFQSLMWSNLATHSVCNKVWKLRSLHIKQSDKVTSALFNLISLYVGITCKSNFHFQLLIINKILSLHNNSKISRSRREKMHVKILNLSSFSVNYVIPAHWVQGVPSYCMWQWLEKAITDRSTIEASNTYDKVTQRKKKTSIK